MDNDDSLGSDLMLSDLAFGADLTLSESQRGKDGKAKEFGDLAIVAGPMNLGQAILSQLRTRRGELADLGFPDYGSRLFEFVGEPNNPRTREKIRVMTLEALAREPRIKEVVSVNARPSSSDPDRVDIDIVVMPAGGGTPLSAVYPFFLEVA